MATTETEVAGVQQGWTNPCRRFHLERREDVSGMSGVGIVAFGIVFHDGRVVMRWNSEVATSVFYDDISHVHYLHSHEGRTMIVWDDWDE